MFIVVAHTKAGTMPSPKERYFEHLSSNLNKYEEIICGAKTAEWTFCQWHFVTVKKTQVNNQSV